MTITIEQLDRVTLAPGWTVQMSNMEIEAEVDDGRVIEIRIGRWLPDKDLVLWGSEPDPYLRGLYQALREAIHREYKDEIAEEAELDRQRQRDGDRDLADRFSRDYA